MSPLGREEPPALFHAAGCVAGSGTQDPTGYIFRMHVCSHRSRNRYKPHHALIWHQFPLSSFDFFLCFCSQTLFPMLLKLHHVPFHCASGERGLDMSGQGVCHQERALKFNFHIRKSAFYRSSCPCT